MYPSFARFKIEETLSDTGVLLISWCRQSGKTTLATEIAFSRVSFLTLDDATVLQSAIDDSAGFIRGLDRTVIDEILWAPDLLLAIKNSVDDHRRVGGFC